MPKPNLLIVGSQKCGTTWLHVALDRSRKIFASKVKELNFFNKMDFEVGAADYVSNFPDGENVDYFLESTPHYFQRPAGRLDVARNIESFLDSPKIIVVFRDPVERYQSAYIHHMMQGRFAYSEQIENLTDEHKLLTFGRYGEILSHWIDVFPDMGVFFCDDIVDDRLRFVSSVMDYLDLENDLTDDDIDFRTNDKNLKVRRLSDDWPAMPRISESLRLQLTDYYRDDVAHLQAMTGRNLEHWLQRP